MRWLYLVAVAYFLLVILFLSFGFGKIISLMTGIDSWEYLKDIFEMFSWVATIAGVLWAGNTYYQSEREKRYERATDTLEKIMELLGDLTQIRKNRDRLVVLILKLEKQLRLLPHIESGEIERELSAFLRGVLQCLTCENIFGPVSHSPYLKVGLREWKNLDDQDKFDGNLAKTAMHLILAGYAVEMSGRVIANDKENFKYLLTKLVKISNPIVIGNFVTNDCSWKEEKLSQLYLVTNKEIASIIYLLCSNSASDILRDFYCIKGKDQNF